MYNENLVGKNLSDAVSLLKAQGVDDVEVVHNDTRGEYAHDCELVVKADVEGARATLTVSKFLLRI